MAAQSGRSSSHGSTSRTIGFGSFLQEVATWREAPSASHAKCEIWSRKTVSRGKYPYLNRILVDFGAEKPQYTRVGGCIGGCIENFPLKSSTLHLIQPIHPILDKYGRKVVGEGRGKARQRGRGTISAHMKVGCNGCMRVYGCIETGDNGSEAIFSVATGSIFAFSPFPMKKPAEAGQFVSNR